LLPFMEQENLYNSSLGPVSYVGLLPGEYHYADNNGVDGQVVPLFLCPSDESSNNGFLGAPYGMVGMLDRIWGGSSYGLNFLVFGRESGFSFTNPPLLNGKTFDPQGAARIPHSIPDGTSNTLLIAHRYVFCDGNPPNEEWHAAGTGWAYDFGYYPQDYAPQWYNYSNYFFNAGVPGFEVGSFALATDGATAIGPTSMFQVQPDMHYCDPTRAATPHLRVMPGCMADGSVRSLSASMSPNTWWYACTPSGGEVMPGDWND
jgi:hypothetical protein